MYKEISKKKLIKRDKYNNIRVNAHIEHYNVPVFDAAVFDDSGSGRPRHGL